MDILIAIYLQKNCGDIIEGMDIDDIIGVVNKIENDRNNYEGGGYITERLNSLDMKDYF